MPSALVEKLAKQQGISVAEAEDRWEQAKKIASEKFAKSDDAYWPYVTGIFKKSMGVSESMTAEAAAMRDPRKYKWYKFNGRKARLNTDNKDFNLDLKRGEVFGIKVLRGNTYLIDAEDRTIQFKLKPHDADRVMQNSKPWKGKVGRYNVEAGEPYAAPVPAIPGFTVMKTNSSVLRVLMYSKAEHRLYVKFAGGAEWIYENVTAKEADELKRSKKQGQYFSLYIKPNKEGNKL